MNRGRLTPVDIVLAATTLAVLGFLAEPLYSILNTQASALDTGSAFLFQMVVPGLLMSLIIVVYTTAVGQGGQP